MTKSGTVQWQSAYWRVLSKFFLMLTIMQNENRNIGRQYKTTLPCLTQIQTSDKQSWKCTGKINEARLSAEMSESN